jgi:hypothetical protein
MILGRKGLPFLQSFCSALSGDLNDPHKFLGAKAFPTLVFCVFVGLGRRVFFVQ